AEAHRAAVKDLISKDRHQRRCAAQQNGKQIQGDRGQDHFSAKYEVEPRNETLPSVRLSAISHLFASADRNNQEEKCKRTQRIEQIHKWEADIRDEQSAHSRADNRSDLENTVVPRHGVCECVTRNQGRKKGAARSPTECAR